MTKRRVREDATSISIAYATGLTVLLLLPARSSVPQFGVLLVGVVALVLVGFTVDRFAFGRPPSLEWSRRPWRYSVPQLLGYFAAVIAINAMSTSKEADWGFFCTAS
jgi:hypothetical protein